MKFNYMKSAAMALAFACCVSSCSDFLEEENKTGATAELEYATVSGIDGLMGSAYSFLRLWAGKPAALAMNGSGTDDLFYGIDCGMKPLGHTLAGTKLFFCTFIDKYVRIHRHTE